MTNSDFVTISDFLNDMLTFLLKVTRNRCVHFTLHLVKQAKNSIHDITHYIELNLLTWNSYRNIFNAIVASIHQNNDIA